MRSCCPFVSFAWLTKWLHGPEERGDGDPRNPLLTSTGDQTTGRTSYGTDFAQSHSPRSEQCRALPCCPKSTLNGKENQSVRDIEQRRSISFEPTLDKTGHGVFPHRSADNSQESNREVEQSLVAASINFQHGMNEQVRHVRAKIPFPELHRARAGSPYPEECLLKTPSPERDDRPTLETGNGDTIIRRTRSPERRGRCLYIMGQEEVETYQVSPIQIDYNKPRCLKTPSIRSSDSQPDCYSPLFLKAR